MVLNDFKLKFDLNEFFLCSFFARNFVIRSITPFAEVGICREVFNCSEFHFDENFYLSNWYFSIGIQIFEAWLNFVKAHGVNSWFSLPGRGLNSDFRFIKVTSFQTWFFNHFWFITIQWINTNSWQINISCCDFLTRLNIIISFWGSTKYLPEFSKWRFSRWRLRLLEIFRFKLSYSNSKSKQIELVHDSSDKNWVRF